MSATAGHACQDCGRQADPRYTMDFTDVEPGAFIHWCAACGPASHALNDALQHALETRLGFAAQLEAEMDKHQQ